MLQPSTAGHCDLSWPAEPRESLGDDRGFVLLIPLFERPSSSESPDAGGLSRHVVALHLMTPGGQRVS